MFFISIVFAMFAALFYSVILSEFGIQLKYWVIAAVLISLSALSLLFSPDGPGYMCFVYIIGVFVVGISMFVRQSTRNIVELFKKADVKNREIRYEHYKKFTTTQKNAEAENLKRFGDSHNAGGFQISDIHSPKILEYSGVAFHLISVVIIVVTMFGLLPGDYNKKTTDYLYSSLFFQLKTSVMFLLIGFVNPFWDLSDSYREKIVKLQKKNKDSPFFKFLNKITEPQIFRIVKSFLTALIVSYFLQGTFFALPWNSGILVVTFYTLMVLLFVLTNLYQMLFYPRQFAVNSRLRVAVLLSSFHAFIFVAAILTISLIFFSAVFNWNTDNVSSEGILLTGFNIVMAYVNYKIVSR